MSLSAEVNDTNVHYRLAGGRDEFEGSLEMCRNKICGLVQRWNFPAALVFCRQLSHQRHPSMIIIISMIQHMHKIYMCIQITLLYIGVVFYKDSSGGLGLRTTLAFRPVVNCNGTEHSLANCNISEGVHYYSGSSSYWIGCQRTCKF